MMRGTGNSRRLLLLLLSTVLLFTPLIFITVHAYHRLSADIRAWLLLSTCISPA